jgi:solute carrier family 35 protein E3
MSGSYNAAESYSPKVLLAMVVNVFTTVAIVLTNKYLVSVAGFPFMVTLSGVHFVFTSLGCHMLLKLGFFEHKEAPLLGVLPVAAGSCLSVGFMNLNLAKNTVGFYQVTKLLCIPVTILMEYVMFRSSVSRTVVLSLVVLLVGVGIATISDVGLNVIGSVYAVAAILATVMGQIFTKSTQQNLKLDHMQLLHHASPIVFTGMFMMAPVFDDVFPPMSSGPDQSLVSRFREGTVSVFVLTVIFASCVFALGVNISNYMVIGQTSPVTYQVVGHFKTMLVLISGWMFFEKETNLKNLFGVSVAVVGMVWYSHVKQKEAAQQKEKAAKVEMTGPPKVVPVPTSN